jgi:hypothetical protein
MKAPAEWARERWQGGRWEELVAQIQQDARAELVEQLGLERAAVDSLTKALAARSGACICHEKCPVHPKSLADLGW